MNRLNYLSTVKTLFMLFFLSISLVACKKQNSDHELQIDKKLIGNVRTLANTGTSSKLAFSMLNEDEKFYLAQEQLNYVLENVPMNNEQKDLVSRIKHAMPEDVYSNLDSRKEFGSKLVIMEKEGLKLLGKEFMIKYFTTVIDINATDKSSLTTPVTNVVGGNDCKCSAGDDWCSDQDNQRYTCFVTNCTKSSGGCGLFWLAACNGICMRNTTPE